MSQTVTPTGARTPIDEVAVGDHGGVGSARNRGSIRHFVRHFVEMVVAMTIGMMVGVGIYVAIVGVTYKEAVHLYPTSAFVVMAVSMAVPMVAWMRFRRHTWRNSLEMGAAMLLPAVPFLACLWAHVFTKAPNGPYMAVSLVAMVTLMLFRWDVYSTHPPRRLRATST